MTEGKPKYGNGTSAAQLFQGWAETFKRLSEGNCKPEIAIVFQGMAIGIDLCAREMRQRDSLTIADKLTDKDLRMTRNLMTAALAVREEHSDGG